LLSKSSGSQGKCWGNNLVTSYGLHVYYRGGGQLPHGASYPLVPYASKSSVTEGLLGKLFHIDPVYCRVQNNFELRNLGPPTLVCSRQLGTQQKKYELRLGKPFFTILNAVTILRTYNTECCHSNQDIQY
jgi:hypothetical protein